MPKKGARKICRFKGGLGKKEGGSVFEEGLITQCTLKAFFNLRQKLHICIYAHIGINKIYKSKKSWSAITLNLNKQN